MAIVRRWAAIALGEILLSLLLLAIAPTFLNSKNPWLGFAIWIAVPTMLGGSAAYATVRSLNAQQAHALFCKTCPNWSHTVSPLDFLDIPLDKVQQALPQLEAWEETDETKILHLSPLDLLR
ncbi:MAG: hypothetical protein AAF889_07675 [Cyanobacteria bacterium P01_D01_bin.73]